MALTSPLYATDQTNTAKRVRREAPRAPVFELFNLDGELVNVTAFGQPALIVMFWATSDRPSQRQVEVLNQLRHDLGTNRCEIVGISVETSSIPEIKRAVEKQQIQFPVLRYDSKVVEDFGGI